MKFVKGGICAPAGFSAGGIYAGFRNNPDKKDLAMVVSDVKAAAAGVYTTNKVKGAPIGVTKEHIKDGYARGIICNSGNANTCAPGGVETAEKTCMLAAEALGIESEDMAVCSTGVIGQKLEMGPFETGIPKLVQALSYDGSQEAAAAIMTTDTVLKETAVEFELDGKRCVIGGISKGSGMINPNMATMLAFITSDVSISPDMLQKALSDDIVTSFNQICVDGDTSTNDTVLILANGMAGNSQITCEGEEYDIFCSALSEVTTYLAKKMAADGEGATKMIECSVTGAPSDDTARKIAKSVISSDLLKAAMFGQDANWGRVLCAIGYTDAEFDTENIDVTMKSSAGSVTVCEGSRHKEYSEDEAAVILGESEILIEVDMNQGEGKGTAWGCDLTYDYVKINGEYRS